MDKTFSNSRRIILVAVLSGLLLALIFLLVILPTLENYLMQARRKTTCELTAIAQELVNGYYKQAENGTLPVETAKKRALARLQNLRYGPERKDYFWVNDMNCIMLMHPYRPDLVGNNLQEYTDPAGKHLFRDFVQIAGDQGEGYVDYLWQWKDDPSQVVPKVSHIRLFKPWNWVLGTGLYVNDIQAQINGIKYKLTLAAGIVLLLLLLMSGYMVFRARQAESGARTAQKEKVMLNAIIERTSDLVSTSTPDGKINYLNQAGFELLGLNRSILKSGLSIHNLHPASICNYIFDVALPEAKRKGLWTGETLLQSETGTLIPVSQVIIAHYSENRDVEYYSTVMRDISKTRKMQQALQQARDALEQRVKERTTDLETANTQLKKEIEERREIERTLRSCADLERIISTISSHFINCPLEDIQKELSLSIEEIGTFFESEHCFIVFYSTNADAEHTICNWTAENSNDTKSPLDNLSVKDWQLLRRILTTNDIFKCSRIDPPLKTTPGQERLLRVMHSAAVTCIPIKQSNKEIGFWGFSTTAGKMVWQDELLGLMRFLSEVFAHAYERRKSEEEKIHLQTQLHQAQKMESVGQLAAGVAHEINTPIQFIGDNIHFFSDSFKDISTSIQHLEEKQITEYDTIRQLLENLDWDYLSKEIPQAIEQTQDGIERVADIIQALKEFSHPGIDGFQDSDLNRLIDRTITVTRNEWKHIAQLEEDYDPSPQPVSCKQNEIGQVLLNIIINACHAITSKYPTGNGLEGRISIRTSHTQSHAFITISDNGCGMEKEIRERIFDPFFTTKEVGTGSGQGLYIAYDIIVHHHKGELKFESSPGNGTKFTISLPL